MELDSNVWGPNFWFFINTLAITYPNKPHETTKKKYYEFIQNLPIFIPDQKMGNEFAEYLDKFPVTPYLDSRDSFLKWVHFIHNKINIKLDKPLITYEDFLYNYHLIYENHTKQKETEFKWKNKIVYLSLLLILIIIVFLAYQF